MNDIATELEDRAAQRDKIAALFRLHPLEDISADTLRAITPHYQQRISELRRKRGAEPGMRLENRPQWVEDAPTGRKKRLDGSYRYLPHEPLGRPADTVIAAGWSTKHGRPFEEDFRLK